MTRRPCGSAAQEAGAAARRGAGRGGGMHRMHRMRFMSFVGQRMHHSSATVQYSERPGDQIQTVYRRCNEQTELLRA